MAKVWPSRSSTVVLARRTVSPGTLMLEVVTEIVGSIWLTSLLTTRLIWSLPRTVGVKARLTPNCLNSMVIVLAPIALSCATGIGNSPPARKLAVSPESAIRFGSARVRTRPWSQGRREWR